MTSQLPPELLGVLSSFAADKGEELDASLVAYLGEALTLKAAPRSADELEEGVGHMLLGFGLADEDDEVRSICEALAEKMALGDGQADEAGPGEAQQQQEEEAAGDAADAAAPKAVCIADLPPAAPLAPARSSAGGGGGSNAKSKAEPRLAKKGRRRRKKAAAAAAAGEDGGSASGSDDADERRRAQRLEQIRDEERGEVVDDVIIGSRGRDQQVGNTRDVVIHRLDLWAGTTELLSGAKLRLQDGRRYGLVGLNGSGKSVLMRRLAAGQIRGLPEGLRVAYASQDAASSDESAVRYVVGGDAELAELNAEYDALLDAAAAGDEARADPERLQAVMDRLEAIEAHTAEERAARLLRGLEVSAADAARPVNELSGGWRMRVSLARALFARGDLLLLDEPTNHVDIGALLFLERFLTETYRGTVVVVSHDRAFLDEVAQEIVHLVHGQLRYHPGNYTAFEEQRANRLLHKQRLQEGLDRRRAHLEDTARRLEAEARKTKDDKRLRTVANRRKKAEKAGLEKTEDGKRFKLSYHDYRVGSMRSAHSRARGVDAQAASVAEAGDPETHFKFPEPAPLPDGGGAGVLSLSGVSFSYGGAGAPPVLEDVTVPVGRRARLAVLGRNGAGKSTLLRLLVGEETPGRGTAWRHPRARVARFTQHHMQQLDMAMTPAEHLRAAVPADVVGPREEDVRKMLGAFGVRGDTATRPMATLSGGQLTRVVLATITADAPNVLVLDEPTNHLDFQSVQGLVESLEAFDGAVVLVTHDRHLLRALGAGLETWLVEGGRVRRWDAGVDGYIERVKKTLSF